MATYNVFIPAAKDSDLPDLTVKVEASNWLVALKESLRQIGEQGDSLANIVCETAPDGSLRVADPANHRVFVLKQVEEDAEDDDLLKEAEERAAESRRLAEAAAQEKDETEAKLEDVKNRMTSTGISVAEVQKAAQEAEELQTLAEEKRKLEAELEAARNKLNEAADKAADEATGVLGKVEVAEVAKDQRGDEWDDLDDWYDDVDEAEETIDGMVADVFLETDTLHEMNEMEAATKVLELANRHVSAEAASVFYSDMNSALKDMVIVAASGPIGKKIIGVRVPVGKGIVGFTVSNGVKLTMNSVKNNPQFYGRLDDEFGFSTANILCVPILHEGRTYGAIEMINKRSGGEWTSNDSNVLESLGRILGRALETTISMQKD